MFHVVSFPLFFCPALPIILPKEGIFPDVLHPQPAVCGNYVLNDGEQCDDGNPFNGDGCSSYCMLEDENLWLCRNNTGNTGPTTCCRALTNPDTAEKVCSCQGYTTNATLYTVTASCDKLNVDECTANTDDCHSNAICNDLNGALAGATKGFECICPPGLIGDGVTECQLYAYLTQFTVALTNTPPASLDEQQFKEILISSGTIATNISLDRITLQVQAYTPPAPSPVRRSMEAATTRQRAKLQNVLRSRRKLLDNQEEEEAAATVGGNNRHLLQAEATGSSVTVTIASVTAEDQNLMTSTVNVTNLEVLGYVTISSPASTMSSAETVDGPTYAAASGFQITTVLYNDTDSRWEVTVKYTPDAPNVLTSLYVSKPGATGPPYTVEAINSYFISQHPCLESQSVCCMNDYKRIYAVGSFESNITSSVGTCDASIQTTNTLQLGFDTTGNQYAVDHLFDAYPDSYVERISASEVRSRPHD